MVEDKDKYSATEHICDMSELIFQVEDWSSLDAIF
jgi:hypothetical protein